MGLVKDPQTRKMLLLACILVCAVLLPVTVAQRNYIVTAICAVGIVGSCLKLVFLGQKRSA